MSFNSRLNTPVVNHAGAPACALSPEMELFSAVATTMLSDSFYESGDERIRRIADLVRQVDPLFVAQLAIYARRELSLRSVPMLLLVELARVHSGDSLVSRAIAKTICRADEISELLACYQMRNPRKGEKKLARLSHQVQLGLQEAFNAFGEYAFAKYDRSSQTVRLRDALFLVHPKAKDDAQQAIFDKIARNELEVPYTWETRLSQLGQEHFDSPEAKQAAFRRLWEELIDSGKLGYMALLRNLRSILRAGVSRKHIGSICARLSDPEEVRRSKQLPFRFFSAYRELASQDSFPSPLVMAALEDAACISVENMEGFGPEESVLLACDVSGSMMRSLSAGSRVQYYDIGLLMAMLLKNKCAQVTSGIFGDTWKPVQLSSADPLANTLALRNREGEVGYSTNGYKVIEWMLKNNVEVDKLVLFTDCQMWDSDSTGRTLQALWYRYKDIHPSAQLYLFDFAGYGRAPFEQTESDVYLISGWSDRIFGMLAALRSGDSVLEAIRAIEV